MPIIDRSFDQVTGLVTDIGFEDGKMKVRYFQDTEQSNQRSQDLRESEQYTKNGINDNFWHCVHLNDSDCLKMIVEDKFNPYTESAKSLRQFLARNKDKYGHCFTTKGVF
jgi:hypothetical protein